MGVFLIIAAAYETNYYERSATATSRRIPHIEVDCLRASRLRSGEDARMYYVPIVGMRSLFQSVADPFF